MKGECTPLFSRSCAGRMDCNFSFEGDEDWDLDLIQDLVRKEEEAIAAKKATQQQPQLLTIPSSYGLAELGSTCYDNVDVRSASLDTYMHSFSPPRGFNVSQQVPGLNPQPEGSTHLGFQNNRSRQEHSRKAEDPCVGLSSQVNRNVGWLQKEVDRLSEQLLFQDQEKLELYRDCNAKEEKLRKALEALAAKEAEIECLKKKSLENVQNIDNVTEASRHHSAKNHNLPDLASNSVGEGLNLGYENERIVNGNSWSPQWAAKETSKKSTKVETQGLAVTSNFFGSERGNCSNERPNENHDHNDTSLMAEEPRARVSLDNAASNRKFNCRLGQAQELLCRDTTARPKSGQTRGTNSELDQNAMHFNKRDISYQSTNLSYKLRAIWDPTENRRRETNVVSRLFALCGTDLYMLLQSTQGSNNENHKVSKVMICNELSYGDHLVNGATDIESQKVHAFSSKLHFILAKLANGVAPMESLIEALLEFCTLRNVEIVESAFRVLNSTLHHVCSFRRETTESREYSQGCTSKGFPGHLKCLFIGRKNGRLQSQDLNKSENDDKFNANECMFPHIFSSRVFSCKKDHTKRDWKAVKNTGLDNNIAPLNEENCEKQFFTTGKGSNPHIANWVKHLLRIRQIALDSASTSIKVQAISTMNLIVMKSHPDSEREQFGPLLFYRSLAELLQKNVGVDVQLQAVQLLFLLLNCPMLFKLFCGCKEDIKSVNLDISCIEGTYEMVLQGLSECISQIGHDMQVYTLRRRALHVLAFIAASGNMGVTCLLSSMHSGCNIIQERKVCNDSQMRGGACIDEHTRNHNSDSDTNKNLHVEHCVSQNSNDVEQQRTNIPMLLVILLNSELDEEEKDADKVDSGAEGIDKERATLVREALILLHSLACNTIYGASVVQVLTNGIASLRLSLSVVKRITNRSFIHSRFRTVQKACTEQSDTIELAKELQQRILSHARDIW